MTSPWVQRNLDNAQFAKPRGSKYEGPDLHKTRPAYNVYGQPLPSAQPKAEGGKSKP